MSAAGNAGERGAERSARRERAVGTAGTRREMVAAVAGAAAAGGLALSTGGRSWLAVTVRRPEPLPPVTEQLTGSELAPLVPAAGLVLLAAAVALVAVRGAGRVLVGLLAAVAGGALGWSGLRTLLTDPEAAAAGLLGGGTPGTLTAALSPAWPALALAAGLLAVAAGLLTVLRGRAWPGTGRRHERPGTAVAAPARRRTDEDRALDAWRALDRGEDPTEDPSELR